MPKRRNPFAEDYSPMQMKTHVSQREVNMGVNHEENMKAVYERTLELLYSGQKGVTPHVAEPMSTCQVMMQQQQAPSPNPPSPPSNQLRLTPSGFLIYGGSFQKKGTAQACSKVMCSACANPHIPVHYVCGHCERNLCSGCRRICVNCESGFCSACSVINYDERCDRVFCLNCSY